MELNLYPLKTKIDSSLVRNLRMRSTSRGTVVWQLDRLSGDVTKLVDSEQPAQRVGATQNWQVGDLIFELQRGCGCNHPMFAWVPPDDH